MREELKAWGAALRRLNRMPGLTATVVISVALGIAANATIFAMISRFVSRPAPVRDAASLISMHSMPGGACCSNFSWPLYEDVRDRTSAFSGVAAYDELIPSSIGGNGEPERVWGQSTTANYFDVAQTPMAAGRGFLASEERSDVVVLGYQLWQRRFAADPSIVGRKVLLSGRPYTVIGIAGANFRGLDFVLDPEFWIPMGHLESFAANVPARTSRTSHWLGIIARLKPGVTKQQANAELATLAENLAREYPQSDARGGFRFEDAGSLPPGDRESVLAFLAALLVVVLLVLAIACANVTNLLLAHAAGRQKEMAIRLALGSSRRHLLARVMRESVLLGVAGGVAGAMLSLWATSALSAFHVPAPVPLDLTIGVDWRTLAFVFALSVGSGVLFGMVPAWVASRPMMIRALKNEDALERPGRRITLRAILVVSQVAMSLVLLCATGLFLRSLQHASSIEIGFRQRGALMLSVDPRVHGYTPARTVAFLDELRERAAHVPGVLSAAATDQVPLAGGNRSDGLQIEGRSGEQNKDSNTVPSAELYMASPGYFETMGIPITAGHGFGHESAADEKVAVINHNFAEKFFAGENPVGRYVRDGDTRFRIIGVAGDIKSRTLGEQQRYVLFRSLAQSVDYDPSFLGYQIIVRTDGDTAAVTSALRQQVHALDAAMAVYDIETMREHLEKAQFLPRLAATLFSVFGGIGLVLAVLGLYGVLSYAVSRRRREMGIRLALGARRGDVLGLIVRQGLWLTAIAMALGLPAAYALARFSSSFLYGIDPHDPLTFATVPVFLTLAAIAACWIPARRASRVDPQTVLRYE
ncbi:ABC transporter permease [Silvibacterium sp.]|uniref:ABC transporter permease n=1 Tax=Silvibacterium sp. TaxID=1964179 RepID=UPI0039E532BA